jgi:uncharacterized protein
MSVPSRLLVALILAGLLAAAAPAAAVPPRVNDEAKFFSDEAIDNANRVISQIDRQYHRGLLIETVAAVPQDLQAQLDESGKEKFFEKWAAERVEKAELKGIYVLICKNPSHIQVAIDKATRQKAFTHDDRSQMLRKVLPLMKEKKYDDALSTMVDFVRSTLNSRAALLRTGPVESPLGGPEPLPPPRPTNVIRPQASGGMSPMGWIVVAAVVFLGFWLVMTILRAIGRGFGGGAGPGGPVGPGGPGGYGYGGGGGGFLSSMLGGVFGAAAGNWLYDSFRGGGHSNAFGDSQNAGSFGSNEAPPPGNEPGSGDFSGDSGGGGDFGSDSGGGGDFGGGGGDFGGGGGDFGGGGGDSGGGGDF